MENQRPTPSSPEIAGRGHTRREFIRNLVLTSAYAAPLIVTLSVSDVASASSISLGSPMMMMMDDISPRGMMTRTRKRKGKLSF